MRRYDEAWESDRRASLVERSNRDRRFRKHIGKGATMSRIRSRILAIAATAIAISFTTAPALALTNLGMVGLQSTHGRFLQAHTDGELHASNEHRNTEETWFLVEVDRPNHVYALYNFRNGKYLSEQDNGCAPAVSTTLSPREQWVIVSGRPYGIQNAVALKSVVNGRYLGALEPGHDESCGGEVGAHDPATPPMNNGGWPGWWVVSPATTPEPGHDFWNTVGGVVTGIVNQISPADVAALLAALL